MEHYSSSVQETEALGRALAQHLTPGTVVAFTGDLGAGKTAFVRGMAQGLGIAQRVTSPTFTIVNEYEGGRLPSSTSTCTGWAAQMTSSTSVGRISSAGGGVCAVEWSETVQEALDADTIYVDIRRGAEDNQRVLTIRGPGSEDLPLGKEGAQ